MAKMDWLGKNILKLVGIDENELIFINTAPLWGYKCSLHPPSYIGPERLRDPPLPPTFCR